MGKLLYASRLRRMSVHGYFRYAANALTRDHNPVFHELTGPLALPFEVSIKSCVLEAMTGFAEHHGVPVDLMGEVVASYVLPGAEQP